MNKFEEKMNALRLQFKAERIRIQQDTNRTIGHLNTAIGQVTLDDARQALRAEKVRVREEMQQQMARNRKHYRYHLTILESEYRIHLAMNPSKPNYRRYQ